MNFFELFVKIYTFFNDMKQLISYIKYFKDDLLLLSSSNVIKNNLKLIVKATNIFLNKQSFHLFVKQ